MASTGIAAVNLGDAVTINSQLGYFDTPDMQNKAMHGYLQQRLRRLRAGGLRRLILDEVSMMEAEQLTVLVRALEDLNTEVGVRDKGDEIGLTLVGDFLQLPPVKGEFAFKSPEWWRFEAGIETLSEIRRQGDQDFIRALRAARTEDVDGLIEYFRPRLHRQSDLGFEGTTILSKNQAVDRLNRICHDRLEGTPVQFLSQRWGKDRGEWKHIPNQLLIKPGAQVMILANRYENSGGGPELVYANGDGGVFMGMDAHNDAAVQLTRTGQVVRVQWITRKNNQPLKDPKYLCMGPGAHPIDNGRIKTCPACKFPVKKVISETVGEVTYMPLRLAYASTVHKSQGLTLDRVQIDISDPFFAAPGMLYVALSRAKTPEGLRLVGTVDQLRQRCRMDPIAKGWR